jgi:hypothetical protein
MEEKTEVKEDSRSEKKEKEVTVEKDDDVRG